MSVDVWETVVIERPIHEVAAFAGDLSNAATWIGRVDTAEWETTPPTRLGSRIVVTGRSFGRARQWLLEVSELTPGEQVAWRTTEGRVAVRTVVTWRPVGDRVTHMVLRHHVESEGINRLLAPWVGRSLRRSMPADLARLKAVLER